jgi:spore coat-associated protein N
VNIKKKLTLLATTGIVGIGLVAGGATYAIFTDSASNKTNTFTAGTLKIQSSRDDIPNYGPMFYTNSTNSSVGAMPTGLWAPGDKKTRGLFLENKGSLEGVLKQVSILPTNSAAGAVTAASTGTDATAYANDMLFAKQSNVIIWNVKKYDRDGKQWIDLTPALSATQMDDLMEFLNGVYEGWRTTHPFADIASDQTKAEILNLANAEMMKKLNNLPGPTNNQYFQVDQLKVAKLSDLMTTPFNTKSLGIKIQNDKAILLGFTVEMELNPTAVDKNSMQGKSVYFTFKTDWEQARNN